MNSIETEPKNASVRGNGEKETKKLEEERGDDSPYGSGSGGPIRLVMAADEAFAMPMAAGLYSALTHLPSGQEVRIWALDAGLTDESKRRITEVAHRASSGADLIWEEPDTSLIEGVDVQMDPRFSPAIFYRLLIPEVLPEETSRVLYIDSDLIFERSLLPLWRKPFEGNAILAVPERIVSCPKAGVAEWKRLGLDPGAPFFNSGLMLINLQAWRDLDVHGQAINYLLNEENDFSYASDQEALNAILAGQWGQLDQRWNAIHQVFDPDLRERHEVMLGTSLEPAQQDPYVIHYTSDRKPWLPRCAHPKRERFFYYLRESGWFTRSEYLKWRSQLSVGTAIQWLKDLSRPYRHKLGLRGTS